METTKFDSRWQTTMRPFMIAMLAGLTLFFLVATLVQVVRLNERIEASPRLELAQLLSAQPCVAGRSETDCAAQRRLEVAIRLESHTIALRHHEASVLLMAALWSRYVGFITGMILALVGAAFILGKLSDTGTTVNVGGEGAAARLTLATASPGIVMIVAGVVLMTLTITTLHQFNTRDAAIYFRGEGAFVPTDPSIYVEPSAATLPAAASGILKGGLR
jgi:hypothetical protein